MKIINGFKVYTKEELDKILEDHKKWWLGQGGSRAYLSGADLSGADLSGADLSGADLRGADLSCAYLSRADLSGADLRGAYLSGADLRGADLSRAYLSRADLSGADLRGAYLSRAYLSRADLSGADLSGADLSGADLRGADLSGADLSGADLSGADLRGAYLSGADLRGADLSRAYLSGADLSGADLRGAVNVPYIPTACPEEGEFIAWKKAIGLDGVTTLIVKLLIPEDAKRSSATGRKCRCDKAQVLDIYALFTNAHFEQAHSVHTPAFTYTVGEEVSVDDFDENRWNECASGIHFFINRKEAEQYQF